MNGPRIFTHGDFDGIVSAALVGIWTRNKFIFFTGPESIRRNEVGSRDVVCDLPHPAREVRAWFDHHAGNIEEALALNWSVGEGAAYEAPSAAGVIFEHLRERVAFPDHLENTVIATDLVDSMGYACIEDWLADTPENIVNRTIFLPGEDVRQVRKYLLRLVNMIQNRPLGEVSEHGEVVDRHQRYQEHAKRATETIERHGRLIAGEQICLLDFSEMKVAPRFSKNMAYTIFPRVQAVLSVNGVVQGGRRTNDLRLSLSLNPFITEGNDAHDCAAIMDELGLGGGHQPAAGGKISAGSKPERIKLRDQAIEDISQIWFKQVERG